MKRPAALLLLAQLAATSGAAAGSPAAPARPNRAELVEARKIWDAGQHNAFTDLVRFRGQWWCTFREAEDHVGGDGRLRVLVSADGERWESAALLAESGIDLRDPKFSIPPDNRLMIVAGGSVYEGTKTIKGRQPRVAFSNDGRQWTPTQRVLAEGDWLWRVTWHKGRAYGVSYDSSPAPGVGKDGQGRGVEWQLKLAVSDDGSKWRVIARLEVPGRPNETTLRFLDDDTCLALVRREGTKEHPDKHAWIGTSRPPYTQWSWKSAGHQIGGPDFIVLPGGAMIAGGRQYNPAPTGAKTVIGRLDRDAFTPLVTFPSRGDNSYPGLVWHAGLLWVSYYSTHEGKTSIYLAKVRLGD
jgi:hypothetical protein